MVRTIIIVGDADCRENDLDEWYDMDIDHETMCINRAGLKHPYYFEHWFSWHADILGSDWAQERPGAELHSTYDGHPDVRLWDVAQNRGGSLFGAIWTALKHLKYDKVILCGCPMDGDYKRFLVEFDGLWDDECHIRSMSGNTKEMFGYPDAEWLKE